MANSTIVHTLERGRAPSNLPRSLRILETKTLDVPILPADPLHVGQRVRIYALKKIPNPAGLRDDEETQTWYSSTPTDVEGTIVGIRAMELAVTEFIIANETRHSLVEHAYLSVQHAQGTTVDLELWRCIARTLLLPFLPHTRHIPIDRSAVVVREE